MNLALRITWALGLLAFLASLNLDTTRAQDTPDGAVPALNDPIEVLTRGPVHEAFAQPQDVLPDMGEIAPKQPPAPIPEQPPQQKPEDENAQWLPGYWAWDPARQDFTWVSGVYRVPPQNRQFVPGYWANTDDGWRWVPGYWTNPNQPQQQFTPEPPAPLDDGPNLPPPDDNSSYIPGFWQYGNGSFAWQPGYWSPMQSGRFWVGPRYLWTPNGYLFCAGFWDLPYSSRGLLFAPVAFNRPLWNNPGWFYTPSYVVGFGSFLNSAFCRSGGSHYYFGNYYGNNYARLGYRPWYTGAGRYDPTFAYHRWSNNLGPNYVASTQRLYSDRNLGRAATPPTTIAMQNKNQHGAGKNGTQFTNVVTPLNQFKSTQVKLMQATPSQFAAQKAQAQQVRETADNRRQLETKVASNTSRSIPTQSLLGKNGTPRQSEGSVVRSGNLEQKGNAKVNPPTVRNLGTAKNDGKSLPLPKLTETPRFNNPTNPNLGQPKIVNNAPKVIHSAPKINNLTPPATQQPLIINNAPKINNPTPPVTPQPRIINNAPKISNSAPRTIQQPNVITNPAPRNFVPQSSPTPRFNASANSPPRVMSQPVRSNPIRSAPSVNRGGGGGPRGGKR